MIKGAFDRFRQGLRKTREGVVGGLQIHVRRPGQAGQDTLDQIEELLISADMGVKSAVAITAQHREAAEGGGRRSHPGSRCSR